MRLLLSSPDRVSKLTLRRAWPQLNTGIYAEPVESFPAVDGTPVEVFLVEMSGLEPPTSSLRTRRSPS